MTQTPSPGTATTCRRLDREEDFASLEGEWDALVERHAAPHAFLTFDWLRSWWECFGEGTLALYEVRVKGELAGLFPLQRASDRGSVGAPRVLRSLTNTHSPRFDFIVDRNRIDEAVGAWLASMRADSDWDALELAYVPSDSLVSAALERACRGLGMAFRRVPLGVSPYVPIDGDWERYFAARSKSFRDNLRYAERKLSQAGGCIVERIVGPPLLEHRLERAFEMERESWKGAAGTAILSSTRVAEFYRMVARRAARRDRFALYVLRVGDQEVAFDYCLLHGRAFNLVKIGYSAGELAKYSPGMVLRKKVLESLFRSGQFDTYEMLGIFPDWKMKWTDRSRPVNRVFLYHPALRGRARFWIQFGVPELAKRLPLVRNLRGRDQGAAP